MHHARLPVLAVATAMVLLGACWWLTDRLFSHEVLLSFWRFYLLRLALLGAAVVALFVVFVHCMVRSRLRLAVRRALAAAFSVFIVLLLTEGVFMFLPASHNVGYSLGSRVWFQWYWGPENTLGYRDPEHVAVAGRRTVFVIGDSFTAAQGIDQVADRFSNRLGMVRADLQVLNLGKCGADSDTEYHALLAHPLQPDVLVLQYYINDIEGTAQRAGRHLPAFTPYEDLGTVLGFVVRNSFLLDFLYWRLPHNDEVAYVDFLADVGADETLLGSHLHELERFCDYATEHSIPLFVVVFDSLVDFALGQAVTCRVKRMFTDRQVPVVDVTALVRPLGVAERITNCQDAHPSARVHQLVADALARLIPSR